MRIVKKPKSTEGKLEKIVPDTSAIIHGRLTKLAETGELDNAQIIIPEIVMGELQAQAAKGKETGFIGVEEIKKLRGLLEAHKINLQFIGERPSYEDILLAKSGRIDSMIQDVARKEKAVLLTCDLPQALVAEAQGLEVKYYESYEKGKKIKLDDFFTPETMSVHLKEKCIPLAKRGKPGNFQLVKIRDEPISAEELEIIQKEIFDAAKYSEDSFVEIGEYGASVVQLKNIRIAICRPPFSDGMEITAVRPVVKLTLDDYKLSQKLKERLAEKAEGVLIAGPPGSGKSTFAASIAEFFLAKGKIVKTMEQPRDLQVPNEITQYGPLDGSFVKTADMLLLVRPDYVIFDEVRKTKDFEIFSDMRLAGIGLLGVVHATQAVDAVQRFIGRIDIGVIPHIVDTIIFIKDGKIEKVYNLNLTVRTPQGMTEADLARPLVEVRDFESNNLEFEIYTYGDQTVVIPATETGKKVSGVEKLAKEKILEELRRFDKNVSVEFLSSDRIAARVDNEVIARLIGKEGKTIKALEEKLGVHIDVEPSVENLGKQIEFSVGESGAYISLAFNKKLSGENANIYVEGEYLFSATVGRKGEIRISKSSEIGKGLIRGLAGKKEIKVFV